MATQYKTVDTSTIKGLEKAERLHVSGWKTGRVGLFLIQFYKKESRGSILARRQRKHRKGTP